VGTRLTFDVLGEVQLDRTLARVGVGLTDARPLWEDLTDRFVRFTRRQYDTEGGAGSGGWQALSPRYAAWKARHYPGKPILERTGRSKRLVTVRPLQVEELSASRMVIGATDDVLRYHQHGAGNLPRRRVVDLPESERRTWVRRSHRFLMTGNL
jgi:hypothetical protein